MVISDESGMKKVGFGSGRVYPKIKMSGSGMSGIGKVGFGSGSGMTFRVSGITSGITYHEFGYSGTFSGIVNSKYF